MNGLFVVREEGGLYIDDLPASEVLSKIELGVPIFGVRLGRRRLVYDRILKRLGRRPWRVVTVPDRRRHDLRRTGS